MTDYTKITEMLKARSGFPMTCSVQRVTKSKRTARFELVYQNPELTGPEVVQLGIDCLEAPWGWSINIAQVLDDDEGRLPPLREIWIVADQIPALIALSERALKIAEGFFFESPVQPCSRLVIGELDRPDGRQLHVVLRGYNRSWIIDIVGPGEEWFSLGFPDLRALNEGLPLVIARLVELDKSDCSE